MWLYISINGDMKQSAIIYRVLSRSRTFLLHFFVRFISICKDKIENIGKNRMFEYYK